MNLGKVLRGWRTAERIGVREAAKIIGISHATLSRIENGKPFDGRTMATILSWQFYGYDNRACGGRGDRVGKSRPEPISRPAGA